MITKKISFDFDGCLGDRREVRLYCRQLLSGAPTSIEVWIVSSRFRFPPNGLDNADIYDVAYQLGISTDHIIFTSQQPKAEWFEVYGQDFIWHLDDNPQEVEQITNNTNVVALSCLNSDFINRGNKLLGLTSKPF